jgi:NAD(P)-dependent dehydrogenase (short-subunit alcohol dehydrogenase family)
LDHRKKKPEFFLMKILLIGAGGTLGKAVARELGARHTVIAASRSGTEAVDIRSLDSVKALFARVGAVDAVACAAGSVHFGPLASMGPAEHKIGLDDKLMGQVNITIAAMTALSDGGSITLTTGILARDPVRYGASASLVNGALESFVKAAALEMPRGLRINAVSPTVLTESMGGYGPYFRGFKPRDAADAALGFARSVEGAQTGQVYEIS